MTRSKGRVPVTRPLLPVVQELVSVAVARGFSQAKWSAWSGVPRPRISEVMNGRVVPTLPTLLKLAAALNRDLTLKPKV